MTLQQILLKYWGYPTFRTLQEEIIRSVLNGNDTLALLPTGGGKSLTFQVPALAQDGLCLVISPLISLMKDQVDHLKKRGIKAGAIYSGMHADEVDLVINNSRNGENKLLYVSPERLGMTKFRDALRKMKVSLIAVDEAHCISQWGYDFRPPYLRIAEIREHLPGVPLLALTATATPRVIEDIQDKLSFRRKNVFRKSFERKNLTYFVFEEEDKNRRILNIIQRVKGPGIIYARNRKQTKEIAGFLEKQKIRATYYHAGLGFRERTKNQNAWMTEEKPVMVATNAFGMGIDKPNVRFVIHVDLPDSLEAYFQEAGRAGRDEKRSYAVLLYEKSDILDAKRLLEIGYPEISVIRAVYQSLGNYFRLPLGSGRDASFSFDLGDFCKACHNKFSSAVAFNSLKLLEKEGYLLLGEAVHTPSRIFIKADSETLYRFQVEQAFYDPFLKVILRSYSGVFSEFVTVSEEEIARRSGLTPDKVTEMLTKLQKLGILDYLPRTESPQLTYIEDRVDAKDVILSAATYKDRMREAAARLEAVIGYAASKNTCRSQALLAYFGEYEAARCGKCDVCIDRNKAELSELEMNAILDRIKPLLRSKPCTLEEMVAAAGPVAEDKVLHAIRWLTDTGKIKISGSNQYTWG
ncbi:MAG TPA: RecQ family ATP-dependent DNA helicase [Bacteroidales bacterium]|nr:RecQ family ATP-dependent DNA helicase [Bacteroidales bacterium]